MLQGFSVMLANKESILTSLRMSGVDKAGLLAALYLCQTTPKGYLNLLPIIMRENKATLKDLSKLSWFTLPDLLKPFFAVLLDTKLAATVQSRKNIIMTVQLSLIASFVYFSFVKSPTILQLGLLFMVTSLMTAVHDTAVDGLAVQILTVEQHSLGAFGQYVGYKCGGLLTGGLLPLLLGDGNRAICLCTAIVMSTIFGLTAVTDVQRMANDVIPHRKKDISGSPVAVAVDEDVANRQHSSTSRSTTSLLHRRRSRPTAVTPFNSPPSLYDKSLDAQQNTLSMLPQLLRKYLTSPAGLTLCAVLLTYKVAEHALDFVWTSMLVDSGVDRQTIIRTQFVIGSAAALLGAYVGKVVSSACAKRGYSSVASVAVCSTPRLFSEALQVLFAVSSHGNAVVRSAHFVAAHSFLENVAGSALTSALFGFYLANADSQFPATSYALMNSIVLLGVQIGKYVSRYATNYSHFCIVAFLVNCMFSLFTAMLAINSSVIH